MRQGRADAWTVIPSPSIGIFGDQLTSVAIAGPNDVWAAGYYYNSAPPFGYRTLIEHWDGAAWSVVPSPNVGTGDNKLVGIAVAGPNDVWAVGWAKNASGVPTTLIEHWNGTAWSVVPSPNVGTVDNILAGVAAVASTDVWAVGSTATGNGSTLTEHWNGTAWSVVPSPNPDPASIFRGVAVAGPNDVWAVGSTR